MLNSYRCNPHTQKIFGVLDSAQDLNPACAALFWNSLCKVDICFLKIFIYMFPVKCSGLRTFQRGNSWSIFSMFSAVTILQDPLLLCELSLINYILQSRGQRTMACRSHLVHCLFFCMKFCWNSVIPINFRAVYGRFFGAAFKVVFLYSQYYLYFFFSFLHCLGLLKFCLIYW